ncbi:MAG: TIR domain-containing protein [Novosphingobium sp.]
MMDEAEPGPAPARYRAFISYSHADSRFASWLHRKLEAWSVPDAGRLSPIFIDRAELAAGPDLSAQVREALAGSSALVVIASPAARTSHWVAQEIALFRELHPASPVLAALIDGEPAHAFPEALLSHRGALIEPLAADFRAGRDGKRLALLKIVAGLTSQPLDRLVQRDAQARTRRVMWITAGALLLSLILAALLVSALRARAEAERQRTEAEGLVEFMLTDLRDKLKGVGRLDVMDAVNERAMKHYAGDNIASLPDETVLRRAKLLLAMGEDDLDRDGTRQQAAQEIAAAWRTTNELLNRAPDEPERIFQHAQSEYWMGYLAFSDRSKAATGLTRDFGGAETHWQSYARLGERLRVLQPQNPRSYKESAYARGALCGLRLERRADPAKATEDCVAARRALEQAIALAPGDVSLQRDLANRLAWEADALAANGNTAAALQQRRRQTAITGAMAKAAPQDAQALEADMLAQMGLAELLASMNQRNEARQALTRADLRGSELVLRDPANRNWAGWHAQIRQKLAQ